MLRPKAICRGKGLFYLTLSELNPLLRESEQEPGTGTVEEYSLPASSPAHPQADAPLTFIHSPGPPV